jgi:glutamate-1-semialdehyde 2,1-aminomutase
MTAEVLPVAPARPLDRALSGRAAAVIPGGMYGHLNRANFPLNYPQFFARGKGTRVWDVDGNSYVDVMCSWGPMILGYQHPKVEAAYQAQLAQGDVLNGPGAAMVELAELLVDTVAHADWAMFAKNGTDATTMCVTVARAATGRRKVLKARGAYHGAAPWCVPSAVGITAEDKAHIIEFEYNNLADAERAAAEAGDDVAAIISVPYQHDTIIDQELVNPEFARGLRALADRLGAALILDDVRCGFRYDVGGSWEPHGVRPDLTAFSKAIANGYPLAAITGSEALRDAASSIFVTGSFWFGAAAMAASVATITELRTGNGLEQLRAAGQQLRDGLAMQADQHGVAIRQSGPVQMPLVHFEGDRLDGDPHQTKVYRWCNETIVRGAYLHPWHNWFLSAAHTPEDIDEVLRATDPAFAAVAASFPS